MILWVHAVLMLLVGTYALIKERRELGCSGISPTRRQCSDEDSVYVRGTKLDPAVDTRQTARLKLLSVLSYHEKGGVWKRCFLLATLQTYLAHLVQRATARAGVGWTIAGMHLLFLAVLYFYWNYINYHHFRVLKKHGGELLDFIAT